MVNTHSLFPRSARGWWVGGWLVGWMVGHLCHLQSASLPLTPSNYLYENLFLYLFLCTLLPLCLLLCAPLSSSVRLYLFPIHPSPPPSLPYTGWLQMDLEKERRCLTVSPSAGSTACSESPCPPGAYVNAGKVVIRRVFHRFSAVFCVRAARARN